MDLEAQLKVSKIMREQAEKLGKALQALKKIRRLQYSRNALVTDASEIASNALKEIAEDGQNSQDL